MDLRTERLLTSVWLRALFAVLCLAAHLKVAAMMGKDRYSLPFNSAPTTAPAFANAMTDRDAQHWNRLVVSRWDSGHYIAIALRGYTACPQSSLKNQPLLPYLDTCNLSFYPTYSMLGRWASLGGTIPIDYALLGVSLVASFALFLLWTSRSITSRIGVGGAYVSLLLFNVFTTGFALVTIQTEPVFLALTLASFVALDRKWYLVGAVIAGAATAMRVSGGATGFAYGLALLVATVREMPRSKVALATRGVSLILPAWGQLALFGYFKWRFDDPFIYFHAHAARFNRDGWGASIFDPDPILRAIDMPLHEMLLLLPCMMMLFLGHREALRRFDIVGRTFMYALLITGLGIALYGSFPLAFAGMNRYLLHALPLFFVIASVMKKRLALLALWAGFTMWHYWQVDLCFYEGGPGNASLQICHDTHWIGHF